MTSLSEVEYCRRQYHLAVDHVGEDAGDPYGQQRTHDNFHRPPHMFFTIIPLSAASKALVFRAVPFAFDVVSVLKATM